MSASVIHPHSYQIQVTSKSLLVLSNELLELVIDNIEQPEHLLSLAKTCRSLYALIVPNHLSFRHIQTHISRDDIWTLLAEKPVLAANVRILNLHGGDCNSHRYRLERIPINFEETPVYTCPISTTVCDLCTKRTEEHISRLLSALQQMHNLSCLAITAYPKSQNRLLQRIFNALEGAHIRLTHFSVNYYHTSLRNHEDEDVDEFPMPLNQLGYLHSLAVSTYSPRHSPLKSLYHALMNNSATFLSSIHIQSEFNVIYRLFTVYWPLLRHFSVESVESRIDIPGNFLHVHVNLETLWVAGNMPRLVAHPRLQSLSVQNMFDLDYNLLPNIRHLSDSRLGYWVYYEIPPCLATLGELPVLESFLTPTHFSSADVALFVNNAPNIKKLSLRLRDFGSGTKKSKQKAMKAVNEFLVHLAKLKNLTHLAQFLVNEYFEIKDRRWPAFVRHVAVTIPSLVYLQVSYKREARWVYLERDGTGKYLRCFYLEGHVRKVDPNEWGGFYYGRALR